jgi:hypothetical protein
MKKNLHRTLFVSTLAILVLILIQTFTGFIPVKSLRGVSIETEKPKLTFEGCVDGSFQNNLENYCREHCGFREWLIRFYNQYLWSCFKETNNNTVVFGKDGWLFEEVYVRDHYESLMYKYTDDTAKMRSMLETEALRLWKVQELLKEHNIHLFVCLDPAKDVIFPEYLPENSTYTRPEGFRAYDYYKKRFEELGIHYIDHVAFFKTLKDSADYPLFYKKGTHWSNIASIHVFDSILRYMEVLGNQKLHDLEIGGKYTAKPSKPDNDLENLLNLLFPMKSDPYWYADVTVKEDPTAAKPTLLTIGDSYFWNFKFNIPLEQVFRNYPYWYYNYILYFDSADRSFSDLDLEEEMMRADYIMLNYGTAQLYDLGSHFLPKALLHLCYDKTAIDSAIYHLTERLKRNPDYYTKAKDMAKQSGKSVEQVLYEDAHYMIHENPEKFFEALQGERLPAVRNKTLPALRKASSPYHP